MIAKPPTHPRHPAPLLGGGAIALLALLWTAPTAWAQSTAASVNLRIGGTVTTRCTVAVTDNQVNLNLVQGQTAIPVAAVTEQCNDGDGYTVTVTSSNSGQLRSDATGATPIAYILGYGGTTAGKGGSITTTRAAPTSGTQSLLTVTTPANAQAAAGSYQDTVTVAITAK